ncbi:MAG TPA: CPBP family intramembrane glutamic endopeptidase [Dongiaceae bacterium]|nr:CPBP family intramembrane glutamic endopeptidase [Dongiaceae bacterium]
MKSAHALAGFILLVLIADQFVLRNLKASAEPRRRLRAYRLILVGEWVGTAWAAAVMGLCRLCYVMPSPEALRFRPDPWIVVVLVIISLCMMAVPVVLVRIPSRASAIEKAMARLSYLLPQTQRERLWWVFVSLTAGICEECLFRSFLFWYLQSVPWRLGFSAAIAVACVLFALGHLYQGVLPALGTGALAFLFFVFFLGTGNLLLPIALHSITDMRVLLLTPRSPRPVLPQA